MFCFIAMVKIKSAGDIDAKYRDGIGRAPANYKKGVQGTSDWQEKASSEAAETNFAAGVQDAIAAKKETKSSEQCFKCRMAGRSCK